MTSKTELSEPFKSSEWVASTFVTSQKVHLLPPSVSERIAAGEVIERPSSVVKELIENSLDAGATEIRVSLEQGGKSLIEILDNGSGMSARDLELCIERHATSKLRAIEDLDSIATLGFRGEALASIAAVTDLEITSREKDAQSTYHLSAGDIGLRLQAKPKAEKTSFGHFIDSPHGTRIQARGLFSQVPARLKFLKSQSAEVSQVREWIERLAIAHPHVGFELLSDERLLFRLPPADEANRIRAILADGEDYPLLTTDHEQDGFRDLGLKVRLYWLQGLSSPQSRKIIQVVNGRAIRDRLLQQAIMAPFRQALLPGQHPAVVAYLDVNPAALDVNIHPTKTEIRFLDSRKIFSVLNGLVKSLLMREGAPALATSFRPPWNASETSEPVWGTQPSLASSQNRLRDPSEDLFRAPSAEPVTQLDFPHALPRLSSQLYSERDSEAPSQPQSVQFQSFANNAAPQASHWGLLAHARYVGQLFQTYLAFENSQELVLVDQHAAHERVRYEKLRARIRSGSETNGRGVPGAPIETGAASQTLLVPEVIRFPTESALLVKERFSWFSSLGFEAEVFGEDAVVFRAIPAEWGNRQVKVRLKNLVDKVIEAPSSEHPTLPTLMDERVFESLASEACKSAIRAGDPLDEKEIHELIRLLFECEHPWNCPHGRPTLVKIPQGKLEQWFQRRI